MSVDLTVEDGIALITFNRPDRLNAMDLRITRLFASAAE
jgi:enoyl-CoA hydratase/carnithine racemase